jgi:hypothetical protein
MPILRTRKRVVPCLNFHKPEKGWRFWPAAHTVAPMVAILCAVVSIFAFRFRGRASLEIELIALPGDLPPATRPGRLKLSSLDRPLWAWLYRIWLEPRTHFQQAPTDAVRSGRLFTPSARDLLARPGSANAQPGPNYDTAPAHAIGRQRRPSRARSWSASFGPSLPAS